MIVCLYNVFRRSNHSLTPGLAVVMVGDRPDSMTYVESKKKACTDVGIESFSVLLSENTDEDLLLRVSS